MNRKRLLADRARLAMLLRRIRRDAGLRQSDVAQKLGEPQSFVSKYESGERALDFVELVEVCDALGIALYDLVSQFEERKA